MIENQMGSMLETFPSYRFSPLHRDMITSLRQESREDGEFFSNVWCSVYLSALIYRHGEVYGFDEHLHY